MVAVFLIVGLLMLVVGTAVYLTLKYVRSRMDKRPYSNGRLYHRFALGLLASGAVLAMVAGLVLLNLPNLLAIPVAAVGASTTAAIMLRLRQNDRRAFADSLSLACDNGVPIDHVADYFAVSRFDTLSERAARFSSRIRAGQPIIDAATHAGLKLPVPVQARMTMNVHGNQWHREEEDEADSESDIARRITILGPYVLATILMVCLVSTLMLINIEPTFEMMFQEFGIEYNSFRFPIFGELEWVNNSTSLLPILTALLTLGIALFSISWLLLHLDYCRWLQFVVPVIGRYYRDLQRASVLEALALQVSMGTPFDKAISALRSQVPDSILVKSFDTASRRVAQGTAWQDCLSASGLIDRSASAWLTASEKTGRVDQSLKDLSNFVRRRAIYRRSAYLSFLFPGLIVLIAIPIFLLAFRIISALYQMVEALQ